jgi:signal transduction histidine kinase
VKQRLQRRLMAVFVAIPLGVSVLFGLFALGINYTIEDTFLEHVLEDEARLQRVHFAQQGHWAAPRTDIITLHTERTTLPANLAALLADAEPRKREIAGEGGRYYYVLGVQDDGAAPWLVAEARRYLVVRPMRDLLLGWLLAWAVATVALTLALAWWLARYMSRPLEQLAQRVADAAPEKLPEQLAQGLRDDEVGAVARRFDALLARTREFIAREQAFTRDASHELRTPLAVLGMAIERLQTEPGVSANVRRQLTPMREATELMEQTVNTLLLLAREGAVTTSAPVAVLPLVERWVLAHADWLDGQALTLDLRLQRDDGLLLPEPVLQLVVAGLLGNAFAHGQRGGRVRIELDAGALCIRNPSAELPAGVGDEFIKGESSTGSGLGLSIVRRLLERHGGRLHIDHAQGQTRARVSAPGAAS